MESDNIQKVSHTSQRRLSTPHDQKQQANTKHISRAPNHEDEVYILCLYSESAQPIMVDLNIEEKKLSMDVDTGVAFSLISDQTRRAMFSNLKLRESKIQLKTYTDQHIKVVGQLHIHVSYEGQRYSLVLLVVKGDGPALLGRNWLRYIRLEWKYI